MSPTGAVIMSAFAAIWWVVGARASGHGSTLMYAIALLVTVAIWIFAFRLRGRGGAVDAAEEARRNRLVGGASAVEGVLILVAVNVRAPSSCAGRPRRPEREPIRLRGAGALAGGPSLRPFAPYSSNVGIPEAHCSGPRDASSAWRVALDR
jgi:hypothetical protein